jgi:hypothetical protein
MCACTRHVVVVTLSLLDQQLTIVAQTLSSPTRYPGTVYSAVGVCLALLPALTALLRPTLRTKIEARGSSFYRRLWSLLS